MESFIQAASSFLTRSICEHLIYWLYTRDQSAYLCCVPYTSTWFDVKSSLLLPDNPFVASPHLQCTTCQCSFEPLSIHFGTHFNLQSSIQSSVRRFPVSKSNCAIDVSERTFCWIFTRYLSTYFWTLVYVCLQ